MGGTRKQSLNLVSDLFGSTMMLHLLLVLGSHNLTTWCRRKHSQHGERCDDMPVVPFRKPCFDVPYQAQCYARGLGLSATCSSPFPYKNQYTMRAKRCHELK